jgi:hypothetical protein
MDLELLKMPLMPLVVKIFRQSLLEVVNIPILLFLAFIQLRLLLLQKVDWQLLILKNLAQKMQLYRSHGITRDESLMTSKSDGDWYYQQVDLGI